MIITSDHLSSDNQDGHEDHKDQLFIRCKGKAM